VVRIPVELKMRAARISSAAADEISDSIDWNRNSA
jgi:hypothetical protein